MSEQALKELERAKDSLAELLDRAASIINLDVSIPLETGQITLLPPSRSFREAWLLRWLLRRLEATLKDSKAGSKTPEIARLVQDSRLFRLIQYLLCALPEEQVLDIVNERKFLDLLNCVYGAYLLGSTQRGQSDGQRGAKRRKISNEGAFDSNVSVPLDLNDTLFAACQSAQAVCDLFSPATLATNVPHVQPRLPVDELGSLVGKVLNLANLALHQRATTEVPLTYQSVSASQNIESWLQLWHQQTSRGAGKASQNQHNSWNQHCLLPALNLLESSVSKTAVKLLEAEIALHAIKPLEDKFETFFSPKWQRNRQRLEWTDIRPTFEALMEHLSVLFDRDLSGMQSSTDYAGSMSRLLDVAIRLNPRSDIRARRARTPWFEAFSLCLVYAGYPHLIPEFLDRKGGVLSKPSWSAVAQEAHDAEPLLNLIRTIKRHGLDYSTLFSEHLYLLVANAESLKTNVTLLASLVKLNAHIFLPVTGAEGTNPLIDSLKGQFSAIGSCVISERATLISEALVPIMQEYARARYLDQWVQLWQRNLLDTFITRSNDRSADSRLNAALIWDDEELFQQFTTSCQTHAPSGFGQAFLEQLLDELRGLPSLRGPSHSTLSKVAIAVALLKVKQSQIPTRTEDMVLSGVGPAVMDALRRNTDYQGQRWRLWALLTIASGNMTNISEFLDDDLPLSILLEDNPWLADKKGTHHEAFLREVYHAFLCITDLFELDLGLPSIFTSCVAALKFALMEMLSNASQYQSSVVLAWDGTTLDLDDRGKLLIACLGRLVSTRTLAKMLATPDGKDLLIQVTCTAMVPPATASETGLGLNLNSVAKAMLESSSILDDVDVVDLCVSALSLSKSRSVKVPTLLQRQLIRGTTKTQAKKVLKALNKLKGSAAAEEVNARKQIIGLITAQHPALTEEVQVVLESLPAIAEARTDTEETTIGDLRHHLQDEVAATTGRAAEHLLNELDTAIAAVAEANQHKKQGLLKICVLASALRTTLFTDKPETASTIAELASTPQTSATNASDLLIHLSLSNITLTQHPALFNQHNIDTLLSSLALLTFSSSPLSLDQDSPVTPTAIFTHLLEPLLAIARTHRRRLTSRHHLLVPLLQRLLATLFYPPSRQYLTQTSAKATAHHAAYLASLPPWLNPRTHTSHTALSPTCARHFSRLLQNLTDPSPSAAKHALRRNKSSTTDNAGRSLDLTDPTKILKRQVSSYLQPLLIAYTQYAMDGYLSPEMREGLMPGLFSVMNAMDGEVMRGMSVGMMGEAQRDVWRGVWEEWGRYGRWSGK